MRFKRIDKGLTVGGKFYRTTFQSEDSNVLLDIDVDVEIEAAHRDPELRSRSERIAMKEHGISEQDMMVERVARAIERVANDSSLVNFEGMARAAIEAMREPTDDMFRRNVDLTKGPFSPLEYWHGMIDGALK